MINPAVAIRRGRNLLSMVEIGANRLTGREFVPIIPDIAIEPTSTCNLACVFCAYEKKQSPRVSMKHDRFTDYVGQAVEMGFKRFHLTPSTGDIFMDRHIVKKFRFLDEHSGIVDYGFYTNFTVPDPDEITTLVTLKKLKFMTISVYGHDCDSFVRIAKSTEKVYARLLANLETLLGIIDKFPGVLHIAIRSTLDMPRKPTTDLLRMIDRFRQAGIKIKHSALYHDWGGYITAADTEGLNLAVMDSSKIYKSGACSLLFTGVQIMATGIVHACACVDVDGTLKIGDLSEKPLRDIVSSKNPLYMDFIEEQQRGIFKPVCQSCGFYKSIYHSRKMHKQDGTEIASIDEFKTKLDDRVAAAKAAAG